MAKISREKKRQQKRLKNLVRVLKDAHRRGLRFEMGQWGYESDDENKCGTPACAFGHYAARVDVQKAFKLNHHGDVIRRDGRHARNDTFALIKWHFGLYSHEAVLLFGPDGCNFAKTPLQAAEYIERFMKNKFAR